MTKNINEGKDNKQVAMLPIELKTQTALNVYPCLRDAKTATMYGDDVLTVVKATKKVKVIFDNFNDLRKELTERLKDEKWDSMMKNYALIRDASNDKISTLGFSDKDIAEINEYVKGFNKKLVNALVEDFEKVNTINIKQLDANAFSSLVKANPNWSINTITDIADILCVESSDD